MSTGEVAPQQQAEPLVLISNLSLPLGVQMLSGPESTARYLSAIGTNGMELTPSNRGRFMGAIYERADIFLETQANFANQGISSRNRGMADRLSGFNRAADLSEFDNLMAGVVRSLHSSPRDATDPKPDFVGRVMFPHFKDSLRTMNHIQLMAGQPLPAVVFPRFGSRDMWYDHHDAPFKEVLFQPKPKEWLRAFGLPEVADTDEVKATMRERGLTGVTWDVFHSQNPQEGIAFSKPLSLASRLAVAGLVHSVHVALDRQDCAEKHSKISETTRHARTAFADPESSDQAARTPEGEMLSEVARNWKSGNIPEGVTPTVVVEMLPGISTPAARKEHATIVANVRSIMDAA